MDKITLPKEDKDLLSECRVSCYRARGSGGQHVNVTDSAVRLTHLPTGLVVTCQAERSQYLNKRRCVERLREKVKRLNYRKPKRVPTKVPNAVKERNRRERELQAKKKRLRGKPRLDES